MRTVIHRVSRYALFLALLGSAVAAHAGIAIIANPGNPLAGISQEELAMIYLGKTRVFPDGKPVTPVDQREGRPIRIKFYRTVTDKDESSLKAYWSKLLFTGKAQPPQELSDDEAVRDWVARNPDALGFIDGKLLDKSVKVLLILP
jgi:ABC-type phosphate transport system substrate-binding protein